MSLRLRSAFNMRVLRLCAHECAGPKKTVIFIAFLTSRGQETRYIYTVFEVTDTGQPLYLLHV